MKRLSHIIMSLGLAVVGSAAAYAQSADNPLPPIMQAIVDNGSTVQQLPTVHGMEGFLVTKGDNRQTMYVTPDGNALIAGIMFDRQLKSITTAQLRSVLPVAERGMTSFDELYNTTTGFLLGMKDEPDLAIFADPLCPQCARFWRAAAGPIARGELTVYVIPIGVINTSTALDTAAKLMATDEPAVSWLNFTRTQVLPEHNSSYEDWLTIIRQNNYSFFDYGFNVTPAFGLPNQDGSLRLQNGVPAGMIELLTR